MNDKMDFSAILQRLERLEAQAAIRNCINRYMEICDALDANTDLNELINLFDEDSIWEGIGEKYAQSFGHFSSRQAIHDMFKGYTQKDSHFVMNAHFVSSEQIYVEDTQAKASWLMLQTSAFRDSRSHLNAAKLTVAFKQQQDGSWKIKHFQTENIFSRPVSHWNSTAELPVPSQK
ncbi:nuclear transport factor 2 family protein [Acinetobacter sp. ANC 3832]|uniref:nuclear transport factor 2 family protein n=1 Tax=Acinetobacter sp. ANC 3832 TaxID=1977874 RepID=UPI000A3480B7|nr:nuclear transport factor 2 family protein [Acinetobacter sp. ANC 3832]OTG88992.1 polyketide cyclase [Acinetobacter sp. ANC 3832]